jgi:hypothetical protein
MIASAAHRLDYCFCILWPPGGLVPAYPMHFSGHDFLSKEFLSQSNKRCSVGYPVHNKQACMGALLQLERHQECEISEFVRGLSVN